MSLKGLITVKDIQKSSDHPYACKDDKGRLCAGAAVGVGEGTEERVELLANAHVDVIVVDTAHGHAQGVIRSRDMGQKKFSTYRSDWWQYRHSGCC
jgi:IMP dehydrogenase